jgi:hypothetical protein
LCNDDADDLSIEQIDMLFKTVGILLESKAKEVVKAVLGFVKVAVVCLDRDVLRPYLALLVCFRFGISCSPSQCVRIEN